MSEPYSKRPSADQLKLGLGCNAIGHLPNDTTVELVSSALDAGVCMFDTADVYAAGESERQLGRLLPADRSRVFILSKFGHPTAPRRTERPCDPINVVASIDGSLRRLRAERLDCAVIHFPDLATPFSETLLAVERLREAGKLASYGFSNFTPDQAQDLLKAANELGLPRPQFAQEEYSLLQTKKWTALTDAVSEEITMIPFFPLASGLLAGKYSDGSTVSPLRRKIVRSFNERFLDPEMLSKLAKLRELCTAEIPLTALALQWLCRRPRVATIIAGATSGEQLRSNVEAMQIAIPEVVFTVLDRLAGSEPLDSLIGPDPGQSFP